MLCLLNAEVHCKTAYLVFMAHYFSIVLVLYCTRRSGAVPMTSPAHTHWALAIEGACAQQDFLQQDGWLYSTHTHTHTNIGQKFKASIPQTQ